MSVTIELPPEIEAGLAAQAAARGLSLDRYLRQLLEGQAPAGRRTPLTPAQRAAFWRDSASALPRTPPLTDDAISRESIYRDRG